MAKGEPLPEDAKTIVTKIWIELKGINGSVKRNTADIENIKPRIETLEGHDREEEGFQKGKQYLTDETRKKLTLIIALLICAFGFWKIFEMRSYRAEEINALKEQVVEGSDEIEALKAWYRENAELKVGSPPW